MLRLLLETSCSLKNLTLLSPSFIHATDLHCRSKDLGIIGIKHSALIAETPYIKCPDRSFKEMSVEHCRIISQRNNDKTKEKRKHINEWSYICIQAKYDSETMICVTARGIGKVIKSPKITWNCLVDMHHRTHTWCLFSTRWSNFLFHFLHKITKVWNEYAKILKKKWMIE